MPRSSGNYSPPAGQPVVSATVISSATFNTLVADLGNELTNSIPRDGTAPPTASLPMGNFKITGIGAATLATDVPQYQQIQSGASLYLTAVAGTNTITASLTSPTLAAYAAGNTFRFVAAGANTSAVTLNINGLGAKNIFNNGVALLGGELLSGVMYEVGYDGTQFNLLNAFSINALTTVTAASNDYFSLADASDSFKGKKALLSDLSAIVTPSSKIQSITSSVAANALTLNYNGGVLDFRNPTLSNGAPNTLTVAANSITIPSGSTLGSVNGQQGTYALLEAYNGGSPVACVSNLAGGLQLDEMNLISPTTISGASNAANVIYSAFAVSANSPYRVVGVFYITEATSGTWATDATLKQGIGGQALATLSSLGYGQTFQTVTRAGSTTYYNTTGKPIFGLIAVNGASANISVTINGVTSVSTSNNGGSQVIPIPYIVPPGQTYSFTVGGSTITATELR